MKQVKLFVKKHTEVLILTCLSIISVAYFCLGINSWKFSYVGDEWEFFLFAQKILHSHFLINPFSLQGVYGEHRVLGSIWQALFLRFMGETNFAWRFSNVILIIPIIFFFFYWIKREFSARVAYISTSCLASSFYLANFFKIGYLNPIALCLLIISLYFSSKILDDSRKRNFVLLGITIGISFYVYIGPLFILIILPYIIYFLIRNRKGLHVIGNILTCLLFYLLIVGLALFSKINSLKSPLTKTVFKPEFDSYFQIIINLQHSFLLFFKNYDYLYNHFVAGSYVDVLTGVFVVIGIVFSIFSLKKKKYYLNVILYINTVCVITITSPYAYAPTTRGIFLVPFACIFAGIGLNFIWAKAGKFLGIFILTTIFLINLYKSQIWVFQETGFHVNALVMREMMKIHESKANNNLFLAISQQNMLNTRDFNTMQEAYGISEVRLLIQQIVNVSCDYPKGSTLLYLKEGQFDERIKKLHCPNIHIVELAGYYRY